MATIQQVELGVLGPLQVRQFGLPVAIPGAKPRAVLTMLGLHAGAVVAADTLVELLWGEEPPRTAAKALPTHISALRRALGDGFVLTQGSGWAVHADDVDASRYVAAAASGRAAAEAGNTSEAVAHFDEALRLWRGAPELPDGRRGRSEKTRWIENHAALVEERADALLATGKAAEIVGELEAAIGDAPLRERRWGQLMLALYRAGRQGEALAAYQRVRSLLAEELGVDPGPDLRRLEAAIVAQDVSLELSVAQHYSSVMRAVTFLLTDIEGSTAAWERDPEAMAAALARHDEIIEQVITFRGGRLIKTRGEGDATFSVFDRPSGAAAAAIELQEAMQREDWVTADPVRIRIALHTGEVELRDGDYFGRAVNRAARLRSLAGGGQILCSGATAELVIDSLPDDVVLDDLGLRQLKNLARPERVFALRLHSVDPSAAPPVDAPLERPAMPAVLAGTGPFVGRSGELGLLKAGWQTTLDTGARAVLIAGEPGVGKTRLAAEWSRRAYEHGAVVLYGRCDEDLGAPYQPFAEALRSLVPLLAPDRLRGLRGVEALVPLVPGLIDVLPEVAAPTRADPDTERYALFDAAVALLGSVSADAPVILVLDDVHWAAKPTLLLLRHLLRFGEHARVQIVGTYRSTDLDRSHPLAAMLADLNRDGTADRLQLGGLQQADVTEYLAASGYDDEDLARALASVTGGNPFFLIEALRHVDESGGRWDPSTLPQGVREAVTRRLSRLSVETNKALGAAAVVGSRFSIDLVERVVEQDLVDQFDEACKAGIVIEEPGGLYRFNHALVRQSLLAELASVRRMRLHQRIAAALESDVGAGDELLAELAYHYFECAWAGNAAKAVDYCRRAGDQAMARLAYEGAADLYDKALHALEELDDELPDRDDLLAELLIARCEALLAAGDAATATGAVAQLRSMAGESGRLAAWGACFDGQLRVLTDPERLDEIESVVSAAAEELAGLGDAAGEAMAHTVRARCLARLGRIGDCETALDQALTAARRARDHRRVNAVLANAPLAALWGPNSVPRAGGRCLDVIRLLRITTGSPMVEAASTRCQGVLDAFRGKAGAGRLLIESAKRSLVELGMRHALLEVEQFAGIVELIADDPAAAEVHLRRAYNGFRRMRLDADTAETAALLARACVRLGKVSDADALCTESERLAGHALKASIAWRTVRAQLLARDGSHSEARRIAEEAVAIAERTDALVDHGDACLALALVLDIAGDQVAARLAAAARAVELYELKGAAALAEKARSLLVIAAPASRVDAVNTAGGPDNACARALRRLDAAVAREAWNEAEDSFARVVSVESRRKIVGFPRQQLSPTRWVREAQSLRSAGVVRHRPVVVATVGERLALTRLDLGTADVSPGAPQDQALALFGIDDDDRIALQVWFDLEDHDAALTEMRLQRELPEVARSDGGRLANVASRVYERLVAEFMAGDWAALAETVDNNITLDDRRSVVDGGVRRGRDTVLANMRAIAHVGMTNFESSVVAVRGQRLALARTRVSGGVDPGALGTNVLIVVEVDARSRIVAGVAFDPDDLDVAFEELDARYLAGEAAPYAETWVAFAGAYTAFNRGELYETTADETSIDHRRGARFAPGELIAYLRAAWEDSPGTRIRTETVHRLTDRGVVVTHLATGMSRDGFDAEWRDIAILMVDGGCISRTELFNTDDLDHALARFEELNRPTAQPQNAEMTAAGGRLENTATRAAAHLRVAFARRDWSVIAGLFSVDVVGEDRRDVIGGSRLVGRSAEVANLRTMADLGATSIVSSTLAIRGDRLALHRTFVSGDGGNAEVEFLTLFETDADGRIAADLHFDAHDYRAAFTELDDRYIAGLPQGQARAYAAIARGFAEIARGRIPALTTDFADADYRRVAGFESGGLTGYLRAGFGDMARSRMYIESVHRVSSTGAVFTHVATGASRDGLIAEWRVTDVVVLRDGVFSRCELFDSSDVDAALVRFDELHRTSTTLVNTAARVCERFRAAYADRDWDALAGMLAEGLYNEDRRSVENAGIRRGRGPAMADLRAAAESAVPRFSATEIATRGERLVLVRGTTPYDDDPDAFRIDSLQIAEIGADERISAIVMFDADDLDTAIEELDARFGAGEAAPYANTWAVITRMYRSLNRRTLPHIGGRWAAVDHRRGSALSFAHDEILANIVDSWDQFRAGQIWIEEVHRLSARGAVMTHTARGTSENGFDVEWRDISVVTVDGDVTDRCELFDGSDLDAALRRFDELEAVQTHMTNAATRINVRLAEVFNDRDLTGYLGACSSDARLEDRRRGFRYECPIDAKFVRALLSSAADSWRLRIETQAVRGHDLALSRYTFCDSAEVADAVAVEALLVIEVDTDELVKLAVVFDADDFDGAFAELDARHLAGEAAAHAATWSAIVNANAAFNRREMPPTAADWVNVDHRRGGMAFAPGDQSAYMEATWDVASDISNRIVAVHRLQDAGVVFTQLVRATSRDGFTGEWRDVVVMTFVGDLINRCEVFDEGELDAALARFQALNSSA